MVTRHYFAEVQGIDQKHIKYFKKLGKGLLVQFTEEVRGLFTVDHDNNEYLFFHETYGYGEVYDFITAKNKIEALNKMRILNKEVKK